MRRLALILLILTAGGAAPDQVVVPWQDSQSVGNPAAT